MNIYASLIGICCLAALGALVSGLLAWRAVRALPLKLKQEVEKLVSGQRTEAEFMRASLSAMEGRLASAIQLGTTAALAKSFEQISATTQTVATTVDGLRRQAAEDSLKTIQVLETRLTSIQTSVNEKLHEAVEQQMNTSFARVLEQFTQVQQAMGEVQSAAKQVGDLKRLFSNVKTRGGWGEAQLGAMLEQTLPPGSYQTNFALRDTSRERVDFALRMPSRELVWLPIDAKFPTEDYNRLLLADEAGDVEAEQAARAGLALRIRQEARKIRDKYICPPETVDFAVLYLPGDGLFAEVARIPGLIDEIRARERVMILGPSLLPAMLQTIHLGHVTLDLERRAGDIGQILGATRAEMVKMDEALARLAANASTMTSNIEKARVRTRAMGRVLKKVEIVEGETAQTLLGLADDAED